MGILGFLIYFPFQRSFSRGVQLVSLAVLPPLLAWLAIQYFSLDTARPASGLGLVNRGLFYRFREAVK